MEPDFHVERSLLCTPFDNSERVLYLQSLSPLLEGYIKGIGIFHNILEARFL